MMKKVGFVFVMALLVSFPASAQDWPQYLGPNRNSTSPEKGILRSWPETGPEVLWKVGLGPGFGGPVIKDGKAYILDRDDNYGDYMRCFDMETGEELWSYGYEAKGTVEFPGSRSVPIIEGNYVYSCGHNGDLYCFDINTHQPVWKKNVWTDFGGQPASESEGGFSALAGEGRFPMWAIAQCPLIYGDMLIIASQAPDAGVVAYNKLTGDVIWTTPPIGNVGYVSPSIANIAGEDQVIMISASSGGFGGGAQEPSNVVGIDPENGDLLWSYKGWSSWIPTSSAYDAGDSKILIVGAYNSGAAMIQITKSGDSYTVNELYKTIEFGEHTKPPLYHNGYFYAQYSTNERRDGLVCMDAENGQIMWKTSRNPVFDKGSMILVDDLIIATDGQRSLYLIQPDPTEFKLISSINILQESGMTGRTVGIVGTNQNWSPIALSEGKLLIRGQHQMICLKVGTTTTPLQYP